MYKYLLCINVVIVAITFASAATPAVGIFNFQSRYTGIVIPFVLLWPLLTNYIDETCGALESLYISKLDAEYSYPYTNCVYNATTGVSECITCDASTSPTSYSTSQGSVPEQYCLAFAKQSYLLYTLYTIILLVITLITLFRVRSYCEQTTSRNVPATQFPPGQLVSGSAFYQGSCETATFVSADLEAVNTCAGAGMYLLS